MRTAPKTQFYAFSLGVVGLILLVSGRITAQEIDPISPVYLQTTDSQIVEAEPTAVLMTTFEDDSENSEGSQTACDCATTPILSPIWARV
jgi:hypothetical protein